MSLTVKVFERTATESVFLGDRVLEGDPITVGRGATCTLSLPDPEKHLSRLQVEFSRTPAGYRMTVASQNVPVIVNDRSHGPGSKMMIFPGDSILMAHHELQIVSMDVAKASATKPASNAAVAKPAPPVAAARPTPQVTRSQAPQPSAPQPSAPPPAALTPAALTPAAVPVAAPAGSKRISQIAIGVVAIVALALLFPTLKGLVPAGEEERKAELEAARLDGEAKSMLKLLANDRRDLKESAVAAAGYVERLEGQLRTARSPQERAGLEGAVREARDKANLSAELDRKLREKIEGAGGVSRAEGNLNAAAVALKSKDRIEAIRLLNESVAGLSALRAVLAEERRAALLDQQRIAEQRAREEAQRAEARAKAEVEAQLEHYKRLLQQQQQPR